jgi:hypothetical protein
MSRPIARRASAYVVALLAFAAHAVPAIGAEATVKVGFWNVRSGKGIAALPGHVARFVDSNNCTDPSQPLNAWGVGAMQAELTRVLSDPAVVALGVNEAWLCGHVENIRKALGWKSATRARMEVGDARAEWRRADRAARLRRAGSVAAARHQSESEPRRHHVGSARAGVP